VRCRGEKQRHLITKKRGLDQKEKNSIALGEGGGGNEGYEKRGLVRGAKGGGPPEGKLKTDK